MWKYTELDAYDSISLHDCRTDLIQISGNDLIFDFPDGFWLSPVSKHIDHDKPIKTGHAQLCFHGIFEDAPFASIDLYKTLRIFGKTLVCYRQQIDYPAFLSMFRSGKYELEFITEYHAWPSNLYQCWIWKKDSGVYAECQFELASKSIEYRWNEICYDHEW